MGKKALPAAEAYVYARYHMYRAVYFHKTSRAAELMVRLLFKRYRELLQNASSEGEKQAIVPSAPASVFRSFSESPTLQQYLLLDDFVVTEFFKSCQQTEDRILSSLATGIVNRRLLKATDASDADGESLGKFVIDATSKLHELNLNPDYDFVSDTAADTPYKPYDPDADKPASQIYMEAADGRPLELSSQSEPVAQLKKRYTFLRYYYPESIRDDIDKIAADTLGKEART